MHEPAATAVKEHFSLVSRRLGSADPVPLVGDLLEAGLPLPLHDPRYLHNRLIPGVFPLEYSFSDVSSSAFRFTAQMFPLADPGERRHRTTVAVTTLLRRAFGPSAVAAFGRDAAAFIEAPVHAGATIGAAWGAVVGGEGIREVRAYYDMDRARIAQLPAPLRDVAERLMAELPDLHPYGTAFAVRQEKAGARFYAWHRAADLSVAALRGAMQALGLGRERGALLALLFEMIGERDPLPGPAVMLGVRPTAQGIELKIDVLLFAIPDEIHHVEPRLLRHLAEEPGGPAPFESWLRAIAPPAGQHPGRPHVAGIKVATERRPEVTLYYKPAAYAAGSTSLDRRSQPPAPEHRGRP
jgi:hypothetical protein